MSVPLFAPVALGVSCLVAEAGNQGRPGMVGVAEVIRNRMERKYSSDGTVAGTIFRPWQFSCYDSGTAWRPRIFSLNWGDPQVILALQAWEIAFADDGAGPRSNLTRGAVLYHTIAQPAGVKTWPPRWATNTGVVETVRIKDHVFYNDNGR